MELSLNLSPFKWWNIFGGGNIYRYTLDAESIGAGTRSTNTWSTRLNNTVKLKRETRIQVNAYYRGASLDAQGEREPFFFTNIGIRQDFLDKRLELNLTVEDVFSTRAYEFTAVSEDFNIRSRYERASPVIGLSLSYKINNYKQRSNGDDINEMDFGGMGF